MDWTKDRSIDLSLVCVALFAAVLLALDIGCYWIAAWFVQWKFSHWQSGVLLMVTVYTGSVLAWLCLWQLWRLLRAIRAGAVFTAENVRRMRAISWCCIGAAIISAASALYYLPFVFVAAAAGFMALIVRIVKNSFEQAVCMKDELDLTV